MQTSDKRRKIRRPLRYPAIVEVGGDSPARACTLCDASQDGAQILVEDPATVPNEFTLLLSYDGTARRRCRVVWRSDTQIGVEFIPMPRNLAVARGGAGAAAPAQADNAVAGAGADDAVDIDSLPSR